MAINLSKNQTAMQILIKVPTVEAYNILPNFIPNLYKKKLVNVMKTKATFNYW